MSRIGFQEKRLTVFLLMFAGIGLSAAILSSTRQVVRWEDGSRVVAKRFLGRIVSIGLHDPRRGIAAYVYEWSWWKPYRQQHVGPDSNAIGFKTDGDRNGKLDTWITRMGDVIQIALDTNADGQGDIEWQTNNFFFTPVRDAEHKVEEIREATRRKAVSLRGFFLGPEEREGAGTDTFCGKILQSNAVERSQERRSAFDK